MISDEYREYLRSDRWQQLRSKRLAIDDFRCQKCGCPYGLQVHHLNYPKVLGTEDPYTDLITLCAGCHDDVEAQKKQYKEENRKAYDAMVKRNLDIIHSRITSMAWKDLSNVGIGKRDYCNIDTIKADFGDYFDRMGLNLGYVCRVQDYFRNRRYEVILQMIEEGLSAWQIKEKTGFSLAMVTKVCENPDKAKTILEREKKQYD